MNVTTIKDMVKDLANSLRATTVLPASVFVAAHVYLIAPQVWKSFDPSLPSVTFLAVGFTLVGSYVLYVFNFPLIRLLEGYKGMRTDWAQRNLKNQQDNYRHLLKRIEDRRTQRQLLKNELGFDPDQAGGQRLRTEQKTEWDRLTGQLAKLEHRLDRHYPSSLGKVLPTRLGNAIAAFEDYAGTRYGMDTIALWPRLVPILKEKGFTDFVNQEKSVLDFLLNAFAVVSVLSIELTYLAIWLGRVKGAIAASVVGGLACWVLYEGAIVAARQWGTTVRVAFDLFRHNLWHRLGLCPTNTFAEEYSLWQRVSRFLLYREKGPRFTDFRSQTAMEGVLNLGKDDRKKG